MSPTQYLWNERLLRTDDAITCWKLGDGHHLDIGRLNLITGAHKRGKNDQGRRTARAPRSFADDRDISGAQMVLSK
jgi:hypothetical protein